MSQIKVFGIKEKLQPVRDILSNTIHQCVMEVLLLPADKRAHRFIYLEKEDFFYPDGRSDQYTIIEISMIAGRKTETKKRLIQTLFEQIEVQVGIRKMDIEICIYEAPACNWGFRGMNGEEIQLNYKIDI